MKKITAFHWSKNDDCLGYGDGRKIVLGETLSIEGKPELCEHGLHGSVSIVDALEYASGSHLWVTEISGDIQTSNDKICGQHRKAIIEYGDLLLVIVEFAFWCAERASEYAAHAAALAAKYAALAAEYAAHDAALAAAPDAEYEKLAQKNWWNEKLSQLK